MSYPTPAAVCTLVLLALAPLARAAAAAPKEVDYATQIKPLFAKHCWKCHGAERQESGLRLDAARLAIEGGDRGPSIVPGKSRQSLLFQAIIGEGDVTPMPSEGPKLADDEIALVKRWIDLGADAPPEEVPAALGDHWAFQPVQPYATPAVQDTAWVRNPIDAFILARLEKEGLTPSAEADRATLIRRLSFDLIGLPPTLEEVHRFVVDNRPDAYERLVDRLLASPHYGERWARPWLDLCHYADSDGYLTDQLRPVAWRYRHWLVEALNRDLPFDEFTIGQLAGDLLPAATVDQKLATGFLRNTLSNREGGADLEEFRVEQVVDRTVTVGTVWLGLTVGCARCHDHKYDPISHEEFYQLYAFFDGADEVNIDAPLPGQLEPYLAKKSAYDEQRRRLLASYAEQIDELLLRWEKKLLYAAAHPGEDHRWDRKWEVLGLIWGGGLGEGQLEGTQIVKLDWAKRTPTQKDRLLDYFLARGSSIDEQRFKELKLGELRTKLEKLKGELPTLTRAPTIRAAQTPRQATIHVRGDFRDPGSPVRPDTPAFFEPLPDGPEPDRLKLARWLVSAGNPLTPRVAVNRIWQELFGRGLVLTSEDFGTRGETPSHPELLDWLSSELIERAWSTKAMHRLIVTSATYRQSSRIRPELRLHDPNNTLLARQTSLRLSAEIVRDAALSTGGLLATGIGGPSVRPPQPESVTKEGFGENTWQVSEGADRYRRGLYTFVLRTSPFAQSVTFDGPSPSRICTRRERSNTPLQALTLLNDPVFFEAAQGLAARILTECEGDLAERIDYGFRLCMARPPAPAERKRLIAYFRRQEAILIGDEQAAGEMLSRDLGAADPIQAAAWVGTSSVMMNLHEFITRD